MKTLCAGMLILGNCAALAHACQNAYFPVTVTASRQYRSTGMGPLPPAESSHMIHEVESASFTLVYQTVKGVTTTSHWTCSAAGMVEDPAGMLLRSGTRLKVTSATSEGVTIPPAAAWRQGLRWDYHHDVRGVMTFGKGRREMSLEGFIDVSNTIIARESVAVKAGVFEAFRVESTYKSRMQSTGTVVTPVQLSFRIITWYVSGIGPVKWESAEMGTTELTSFTR